MGPYQVQLIRQSGVCSNGNEGVQHTHQSARTGASPPDAV